MIDKRTEIGKMIDKNRCVYECVTCGYKFIGDINSNIDKCMKCGFKDTIVIVENFSVIDKGA